MSPVSCYTLNCRYLHRVFCRELKNQMPPDDTGAILHDRNTRVIASLNAVTLRAFFLLRLTDQTAVYWICGGFHLLFPIIYISPRS